VLGSSGTVEEFGECVNEVPSLVSVVREQLFDESDRGRTDRGAGARFVHARSVRVRGGRG
jgi:hypothetical protein